MKIFGKGKSSLKSNPKGTGAELPEIVALMTKIVERLDALEKKTDLVISQTSSRSFESRKNSRNVFMGQHKSDSHRHREEPARGSMAGDVAISPVKSECFPPKADPPSADGRRNDMMSHPYGHARGHREKILHKAVCADCRKDCEIPFKPTGERPVYCKECFSKRKAGHPVKINDGNQQAADLPKAAGPVDSHQRQVIVTKKGVGKVTVSEIVSPSARDISQRGKSRTPDKKSRR